ncbi:hypothetical protein ANN_25700 [Periplaneta americana]|uniref:Uncharacterized protein n=1 Tax=Periplaneta americana TaxID=6978 RepID=A0ABQ8S480_PERAM|nr:hypothetical protein ANN_25700 [Periplaneta americana]
MAHRSGGIFYRQPLEDERAVSSGIIQGFHIYRTPVLQLQKLRVVFTRKPKVARCTLLFVLRNPSAAKVAIGGCESVHTQGATFAAAVMLQVSISVLTSQHTF